MLACQRYVTRLGAEATPAEDEDVGLTAAIRNAGRALVRADSRQDLFWEWKRRLAGTPTLPVRVQRIAVVCHGNLCRSPYAAVRLAGLLPDVEVRSSGLGARGGEPADATAARCAKIRGVSLESHITRAFVRAEVDWADLILVMEGRHAAETVRRFPDSRSQLRLLGDFGHRPPYRIPDPWGEAEAVFEQTFDRLDHAVAQLAARLEQSA